MSYLRRQQPPDAENRFGTGKSTGTRFRLQIVRRRSHHSWPAAAAERGQRSSDVSKVESRTFGGCVGREKSASRRPGVNVIKLLCRRH